MDQIPNDLPGELFVKISANEWIALYEKYYKGWIIFDRRLKASLSTVFFV